LPDHVYDLFDDDDDDDFRTVVDTSFWSQPEVPDYPPLAHFGRFEILGRLARGGMAEVYLAREKDTEGGYRHLVVKRVLPEMEDNPDLLRMFLTEGKMAVRLYHQNVCHVYECGEIDGATFMALEWVWGPQLQEVIERMAGRDACTPWPVAVEIVAQVAAALHYVHHAKGVGGRPLGIIHRDVSPHNVMLNWGGGVKLLDFGIAKTSGDAGAAGGAAVGKYGYMSPEQAQSRPVDQRSDIFALGIVLYEVLTGKPLYDRPTLFDTLGAIVREPVPSLRAERPELPEALEHVIVRALAKDPAHRFQSAGEFRASLKQILRTNGQAVTEQRIAPFLDGLFQEGEKVPLRGQAKLTGSFQALTAQGAAAVRGEEVTYQTFDHSLPSAPPPPLNTPVRKSLATTVLTWIALALLAVLMVGAGAAVALWIMQ